MYDLTENIGYIQIGISHDTSEFAYGSIRCSLSTLVLQL
ncbi:hypothetical protein IQ268_28370 [Oculatella sp. LEGE 06141]|nr:hypothetical protein [Oculatella sp. LEGE 06141]